MRTIDFTHDVARESWVASANEPGSDFPIQNLPFAVFHTGDGDSRIGVGIGDSILDLRACATTFAEQFVPAISASDLTQVMSFNVADRVALRHALSNALASGNQSADLESALVSQSDAVFTLPCQIRDYTDFYASVFHATNVGCMFRPDNPLLPNYKHVPIGYHGRSSSIVPNGTEVRRPVGQKAPAEAGGNPTRSAAALLDYELEVGFFVAQGNELGSTIPIAEAEDYLFGMCLLNDWSARDLQKWEYQPLGPFLAKSFATTISPWIVTMEALAPFRSPALERSSGDPTPLPYLSTDENAENGGVDIQLDVYLATSQMRESNTPAQKLSGTQFTNMYWTIAQILTHHASNGCNMQPGDLMASGTVSGPDRSERGCLLEMTWNGGPTNPVPGSDRTPITFPTGEERKFLADGDEVILKGYCERENHRRIGFGECRGVILPANPQ